MQSNSQVLTAVASVALLVPCVGRLGAQSVSRGPFSTMANGLSFSNQSSILVKNVGDQVKPPVAAGGGVFGPQRPDFSHLAMFGSSYAGLVEIDAMSTGNDLIFVDSQGKAVTNPNNTWAALLYSVTDAASLTPSHPAFGSNEMGNQLFSRVLSGSGGISSLVAGRTFRTQEPVHQGTAIGSNLVELDAIDYAIPIIEAGGGGPGEILISTRNRFFFSVTSNSASLIKAFEQLGGGSSQQGFFAGLPQSGASLLEIDWIWNAQTLSGQWSAPIAFQSPAALGLTAADEVDALGVHMLPSGSVPHAVFFSTSLASPSAPSSQLRVLYRDASSNWAVGDFKNSSGLNLDAQADIDIGDQVDPGDDIDALCGLDPEGTLSNWIGTPLPSAWGGWALTVGEKQFTLSVARDNLPGVLKTQVHGWASGLPEDGTLIYWAMLTGGQVWQPIFAQQRSSRDETVEVSFPIGAPATLGLDCAVYVQFIGPDGILSDTWSVGIKL